VQRWNMLHPDKPPKRGYVSQVLDGASGPFNAASDYMRTVAEQIAPWVPGTYVTLGTDGFGRSDNRSSLRRHFEVDAESITVAALNALVATGAVQAAEVSAAIKDLGIDPEKVDPASA